MKDSKKNWKKILKTIYINGFLSNKKEVNNKLNFNKNVIDYVLIKSKKEKLFLKERYLIDLNSINLGKFAWLFVSVDRQNLDKNLFSKKILKIINVHTIAEITGNYDYAIKIIGSSIQNINNIILTIEKIFPEIIDTEMHFVNKEFKTHFLKYENNQKKILKKEDILILAEKEKNPLINLYEIAKKYSIHRNTVSNKWKKFWTNKILLKKTIELTPKGYEFIEMGLKSFIIIKSTPGMQEKLIQKIIEEDKIQDIFTTIENEIFLLIRTKDSDELAQFYETLAKKCPNIKKTNTIIFLTKKTKSGLGNKEVELFIQKRN